MFDSLAAVYSYVSKKESELSKLDSIMSTMFLYKNKYPDTMLYKKYTTIGGISSQIYEQKTSVIYVNYLKEINIGNAILWEIETIEVSPQDVLNSIYLKWYRNE